MLQINTQNIAVAEVAVDNLSEVILNVAEKNIDNLTKDGKGLDRLKEEFFNVRESFGEAINLVGGDMFKKLELYRLRDTLLNMYLHGAISGIINTADFSWVQKHMQYSLCSTEQSCKCINQVAKMFSADELVSLLDEEDALRDSCGNLDEEDVIQTIRNLLYVIAELRKDADNVE